MSRGGTRPPTPAETAAVNGGHPHGPTHRDLAQVELARLRTLASVSGLEPEVWAMVKALRSDPTHQVVARIVERTGKRYGEVVASYTDEDLAFEVAREIVAAEDRADTCPKCGTKPEEVFDLSDPGRIRPLERGKWKWLLHSCGFCQRGHTAEQSLSEDDRKLGTTYRVAWREPGDPDIDDG